MNIPIIYIVDDEPTVREGMEALFSVSGFKVKTFDSGDELLAQDLASHGCILLDIRMPELNGLQVQEILSSRGVGLPIIFLTAYGDIPLTVKAIKAGAVDFLTKPVDGAALVDRVQAVLADHRGSLDQAKIADRMRKNLALLTSRERQIVDLVLQGLATRDIAKKLGISHRTVEVHRSHIVKKTGTENLFHFCRIVAGFKLKNG